MVPSMSSLPDPQQGSCLSAAEAELAALFHNGKEALPSTAPASRNLAHPQPPTPIQTDNSTASGIANDSMKQRRSKAIDMRFYWIRDRVRQGKFIIYWRHRAHNKADYFTKHHPVSHHQQIRSSYLHMPASNPACNYFQCFQDELSPALPNSVAGEGVLIPGNPETIIRNHVSTPGIVSAPK
jgi:hypothetical protein